MKLNKINSNSYLAYFLLAFVAMAGLSYMNYLPSLVNALAGELGFTNVEAGQIVAVNGYGGLLGISAAIFFISRVNVNSALIKLLLLLAAVDVCTIWMNDYSSMLSWRFLSGLIGGFTVGIAFSQLAKTKEPDRGFGFLLLIQFIIGSLVIAVLPWLKALISAHVIFYVMAIITITSIIFQLLLPNTKSKNTAKLAIQTTSKINSDKVLLLLTICLYQIAASAIWAYVSIIGQEEAKLDTESVSIYIAATGLLGLLGALLPIVKGSEVNRLLWIVFGIGLSSLSMLLLVNAEYTLFYILSMAMLFISWPAVQSFLLAIAAEMDDSGKLVIVAALLSYLGVATGPLFASIILNFASFTTMLYCFCCTFLLCLVFLRKPVKHHEMLRKNLIRNNTVESS